MTLVQVIGTAGSGRTTIMGANAIVQALEGKKVSVFADEHKDLEPYIRANEWIKGDLENTEHPIKFSYMHRDASVSARLSALPVSELPEVALIDIHSLEKSVFLDAVEVHKMLSEVYKNPVVYVSIQVNRGVIG